MNDGSKLAEVDVSRQARALSWLRLSDQVLVLGFGYSVLGLLVEALTHPAPITSAAELLAAAVLGFVVYTGWRHAGVIQPRIWRSYLVIFPVMLIGSALFVILFLSFVGLHGVFDQQSVAAIRDLSLVFGLVWVAIVGLLGLIALLALLRRPIAGLGLTVPQLGGELHWRAGLDVRNAGAGKPINRTRGILAVSGGLAILLSNFLPDPANVKVAEELMRLHQSLQLVAYFLLLRARRYFQPDADSVLHIDQRPPILFLRSFDDDEKQKYQNADRAFVDFSLETRLSNHFSRFGPFVAIGSPKEKVPQLGAARVLLADDQWQDRVLDWMRRSQTIVMYSGKTHWVNWELGQVIASGSVPRLIMMMPELKSARASKRVADTYARVDQMRYVFKGTPWEDALASLHDFEALRAIRFRPDGTLLVVRSRRRQRDSYHLAALVAHESLLESAEVRVPGTAAVREGISSTAGMAGAGSTPARVRGSSPPIPAWRYIGASAIASLILVVGGFALAVHFVEEKTDAKVDPSLHALPQPVTPDPDIVPSALSPSPSSESPQPSRTEPAVVVRNTPEPVLPEPRGTEQTPGEPQYNPAITPASGAVAQPVAVPPQPLRRREPAQRPDPADVFFLNARAAMARNQLASPVDDCAFYWARELQQQGDARGVEIEKQAAVSVGAQIDRERAAHNYAAALRDLDALLHFYPGNTEMLSIKSDMEQQQRREAVESQLKKFTLEHRHIVFGNNGQMAQAYCVGVLAVAPNGMAAFDCTGTVDPQGRCDHVLFQAGAIKDVKFLGNGLLHVSTNHQGNFDFYGETQSMQGAFDSLHALARK